MIALLDVNVLLALAWASHSHWAVASRWFKSERKHGWATCLVTQWGFLRISTTTGAVGRVVAMSDARALLAGITAEEDHVFWAMDAPVTELHRSIRILGPKQVTDAMLLDLAIRKGGRLVTFDQKIQQLLPDGSPFAKHIELLAA